MNKHRIAQKWHGIWFIASAVSLLAAIGSVVLSAGGLVWHGHGYIAHKQDAEREQIRSGGGVNCS